MWEGGEIALVGANTNVAAYYCGYNSTPVCRCYGKDYSLIMQVDMQAPLLRQTNS